ncbi:MAG TPA: hypothetical protein VGE51_16180 [Fontimonas sp.]
MSAYGLLELLIVGLVVGMSAWSVVRPWLRRRAATTAAKACGTQSSNCGGCSGCGSNGTAEQPIRFHK